MSAIGRIFRVFVSSTFRGFEMERDALHTSVFRDIGAYCRARGARFQAIDLRWGISEEASLDQRTIAACLGEIRHCREISPDFFFIALLGDRYGSYLPPEVIPAPDFDRMLSALSPADRNLVGTWYRLDENASPTGAYVLLPRRGRDAVDGGVYADLAQWEPVQSALVQLLSDACQQVAVEPATRVSILASITEREIDEGIFAADGDRHALCFVRTIEGAPDDAGYPYFESDALSGMATVASAQLTALKERVRARIPSGIVPFTARYEEGRLSRDHLPSFCEQARSRIIEQIEQALASDQSAGTAAARAHQRFSEERLRHFTGRAEQLALISTYLAWPATGPLLVSGPAGIGKTALLLAAENEARRTHEQAVLLHQYIGGTSPHADVSALLRHLCQNLIRRYEAPGRDIPSRREDLISQFPDFLALATPQRPLIIFLDALDQLRDAEHDLAWLPATLPAHVHLVTSMLAGPTLSHWQALHPAVGAFTTPPLGEEDAKSALDKFLSNQPPRVLQPEQRNLVLSRFVATGSPLYWRLASEEVRQWRSWHIGAELPQLPADTPSIAGALLDRLELPVEHGPDLVEHALGLIGAARDGLADDELLAVVNRDPALVKRITQRSPHAPDVSEIPIVLWARLAQDLDAYLTERDVDDARLLDFYHRQIGEVVAHRYLSGRHGDARHRDLALYFADAAAEPLLLGQQTPNARKLAELPTQQALAGQDAELRGPLTDASFMQLKIQRFGVDALLGDYAFAPGEDGELQRIADTLRAGAVVLTRAPEEARNQAQGRAGLGSLLHASLPATAPRFDLMSASLPPAEALMAVLQGHTGDVRCCAFSRDGTRVLSASDDHTVRMWNLETGQAERIFIGHTEPVMACAFSPDGRHAVSASKDFTLRLWDVETGASTVLEGHSSQVVGCVFTPDGRRIVSNSASMVASTDELRVWDVATGQTLRTFKGNRFRVGCFSLSHDGTHILSDSPVGGLRLWSLDTGGLLQTFKWTTPKKGLRGWWERITSWVSACALSPDGQTAMATSPEKNTLQTWDVANGQPLRLLEGHTEPVYCCAFSPDSRYAVSGSYDGTLRLWEIATGACVRVIQGHTKSVNSCAFHPSGSSIMSASDDRTVRLWKMESHHTARPVARHQKRVSDCVINLAGDLGMTTAADGTVLLWNMLDASSVRTLQGVDDLSGCAFSPDGQYALCGSEQNGMTLWDVRSGNVVRTFKGHSATITSCAFHPSGAYVLSASWDKTLRLWDATTGKALRTYYGHRDAIYACAFDREGRRMLSAGRDGAVRLWNVQSEYAVRTFSGHAGAVWHCAFSPDERHILSASSDQTLRTWEIDSGQPAQVYRGHTQDVRQCLYLPDGIRFFSVSDDGTLRYWDVETGEEAGRWTSDAELRCCAYHHGRSRLLVGDDLGGVHFLDFVQ